MGSNNPLRLPTIYFAEENLESGAIRDDIRSALEEFGCFEVVYDKVPLELQEAFFALSEDMFDHFLEAVRQNNGINPYEGYATLSPKYPLYEAFGIEDATKVESAQNFTNLMWPEGKAKSSETLHAYAMRLSELEMMVKKMVFESLGIGKYYDSHVESIYYRLRLNKYKGPMTEEAKVGIISHTDKSFFTILHQHQNQVHGLEVQTKDGEWIRVTPSPSSFIFMVGDAFYAWSNGRVHCPPHRVMMNGNKARYSTALFSFSRDMVRCPKELIDEGHPLLFKPFDQKGLLKFFLTEEGQKAESALKAYCGV